MDSIIIRKHHAATPEREPRNRAEVTETDVIKDLNKEALPVLRPPKTEFDHHAPTAVEGDIVPNPNTDVEAARANVARAYGDPEALK